MYIDNRIQNLLHYLLGQLLGGVIGAFVAWALLGDVNPAFAENWGTSDPYRFMAG